MGLFGKKRIVDLSAGYRAPARKIPEKSETSDLNFLSDMASSNSTSTSDNVSWDNDSNYQPKDYDKEKRIKLTKRLLDMTEKIEDLSNQIYHLKQRIELLEKKLKIKFE
ncbi:hypothetical protein A3K82_01410 [Candidatus Pacearchaeota archaeon RBG_19FT_COMBO_34_9]|nr:MAG: hypothetical protein A3K82_01410 [Candidatus Pacearchaeota archaeon RBG_19FT_COMBO_34_9]OGJ16925.1 MAG: hypothetical protein A3K74_02200 [Candidatus Pacearchaeota archaeon RBG_13_33_26]